MEEYIKKHKMRTKIFALLGVVSIAAFVLIWIYGVPFTPLMVLAIVFFAFVSTSSTRCIGYDLYKANGMEEKLSDIDMSSPVYPDADIYFGSRAFYIPKAGVALAFEDVENVYIYTLTTRYNFLFSHTTNYLCFHRRDFETDQKKGFTRLARNDFKVAIKNRHLDEINSFVKTLTEQNPMIKKQVPLKRNNKPSRITKKGNSILKILGIGILGLWIFSAIIYFIVYQLT